MKLLNREQIETLSGFKSEDYLTTSFYLDTDKSRLTKKEINLSLKNLINDGQDRIEAMDIGKETRNSLLRDLKSITDYCRLNLNSYGSPGLAVFSCSGEKFLETFELPSSPRSRILFDMNPYVRVLSAILNEHNRLCVLVIDRKSAAWYDIYAGEIKQLETLKGDVPGKVREGGWEGYESKRIERHIDRLLRDFFKSVAHNTFALLKAHAFDWLFIGCPEEYSTDLIPLFHPYLQQRLKGRLKLKPSDSESKILEKALALEKALKKQSRDELVDRYVSLLEKDGLAISGLKRTLRSLNRGEVQTLIVVRHFSKPGRICNKCGFLFSDEKRCHSCGSKTEPVIDIIDEAVESAMDKRCEVKHIEPPSKLSRYGNIGALLRYKSKD